MKKLINWLILGLALACGAPQDDAQTDDESGDIGQAEQAMSGAGPTYGVSTATSKTSCNFTNSGQVCTVPLHHTIKYCYGNGITASEITVYEAAIANLVHQEIVQSNMFTMQRVFAGSAANCEAASLVNAELKIKAGTCSGSSTSTSIDAYVCLGVGNTATLTESLPGSWSSHASGQITVDEADIAAHGSDGTFIAQHGIFHSVAGYWGVGANDPACVGGTGTGTSFCATQRFINPVKYECQIGVFCAQHTLLSSTQVCEISNYVVTSPTTWAFGGFTCP